MNSDWIISEKFIDNFEYMKILKNHFENFINKKLKLNNLNGSNKIKNLAKIINENKFLFDKF